MEVPAEDYELINYDQIGQANQLMDRIIKENGDKKFSVVMDIGCGSGNITLNLSKKIKNDLIVALDIDPEMIKYAKENHSSQCIEYMIQDIGVPWDQFNEKIKSIEGKVSLVFSNHALPLVEDQETAAINISKLLSPTGVFYANMFIDHGIYKDMTPEERENHEKILKVPSSEEQVERWRNALKAAGFAQCDIQVSTVRHIYPKSHMEVCYGIYANNYKRFIMEKDPQRRDQIWKNGYSEICVESFAHCCKELDQTQPNGERLIEYTYGVFQTSAKKL